MTAQAAALVLPQGALARPPGATYQVRGEVFTAAVAADEAKGSARDKGTSAASRYFAGRRRDDVVVDVVGTGQPSRVGCLA
jgi:hypothetical protein